MNFEILQLILKEVENNRRNQTGETVTAKFTYFNDESGSIEFEITESSDDLFILFSFATLDELREELKQKELWNENLFSSPENMDVVNSILTHLEQKNEPTIMAEFVFFSSGKCVINLFNLEAGVNDFTYKFSNFEVMKANM